MRDRNLPVLGRPASWLCVRLRRVWLECRWTVRFLARCLRVCAVVSGLCWLLFRPGVVPPALLTLTLLLTLLLTLTLLLPAATFLISPLGWG